MRVTQLAHIVLPRWKGEIRSWHRHGTSRAIHVRLRGGFDAVISNAMVSSIDILGRLFMIPLHRTLNLILSICAGAQGARDASQSKSWRIYHDFDWEASLAPCGNGRHTASIYKLLVYGLKEFLRKAACAVMQFLLINAFDCLAVSVFIYILVSLRDRRRRGGLPYPPGPTPWPIIGNLLDVPKDTPWSTYVDMSKKYGTRNIL
jgi:hypothetical protein